MPDIYPNSLWALNSLCIPVYSLYCFVFNIFLLALPLKYTSILYALLIVYLYFAFLSFISKESILANNLHADNLCASHKFLAFVFREEPYLDRTRHPPPPLSLRGTPWCACGHRFASLCARCDQVVTCRWTDSGGFFMLTQVHLTTDTHTLTHTHTRYTR